MTTQDTPRHKKATATPVRQFATEQYNLKDVDEVPADAPATNLKRCRANGGESEVIKASGAEPTRARRAAAVVASRSITDQYSLTPLSKLYGPSLLTKRRKLAEERPSGDSFSKHAQPNLEEHTPPAPSFKTEEKDEDDDDGSWANPIVDHHPLDNDDNTLDPDHESDLSDDDDGLWAKPAGDLTPLDNDDDPLGSDHEDDLPPQRAIADFVVNKNGYIVVGPQSKKERPFVRTAPVKRAQSIILASITNNMNILYHARRNICNITNSLNWLKRKHPILVLPLLGQFLRTHQEPRFQVRKALWTAIYTALLNVGIMNKIFHCTLPHKKQIKAWEQWTPEKQRTVLEHLRSGEFGPVIQDELRKWTPEALFTDKTKKWSSTIRFLSLDWNDVYQWLVKIARKYGLTRDEFDYYCSRDVVELV
ncbi:hypothetical protein NEMBOFW57_010936 [Staphylotrichum longicolle]|uniref:Uncharacterized protein n=1 Tax=Staphylotrichum longicolle TaxID=669026 RepID=A0AAD4ESI6_9PEZI|nr:hypothetical protein NEMBOFW57_010936 [Staphylotrichum longicolle]